MSLLHNGRLSPTFTSLQDLDKEDDHTLSAPVRPDAIAALMSAQAAESEAKQQLEKRKADVLRKQHGFCAEGQEGDNY